MMRTDAKDVGPEHGGSNRGYGRRRGACFTRVEAVARSLALSCTPFPWAVTR